MYLQLLVIMYLEHKYVFRTTYNHQFRTICNYDLSQIHESKTVYDLDNCIIICLEVHVNET